MWPTKPRFYLKKRLVAVKRRRKVETFLDWPLCNDEHDGKNLEEKNNEKDPLFQISPHNGERS